jgi:hypothetical protein
MSNPIVKAWITALVATAILVIASDRLRMGPATAATLEIPVHEDACPKAAPAIEGIQSLWICDPIKMAVLLGDCTAYTFGHGNNFTPESSIHTINPRCQIHAFDPWVAWAFSAPPYVALHGSGIGTRHDSLVWWVQELGHEGRTVSLLYTDCGGCETHDAAKEIALCRSSKGTNFTQVVMVVDLSVTDQGAWDRGVAGPMTALGYVVFHQTRIRGMGWWMQEVSFVLA